MPCLVNRPAGACSIGSGSGGWTGLAEPGQASGSWGEQVQDGEARLQAGKGKGFSSACARRQVIALDRSHAKAREIRQLAEELGITCVKAYKMDAGR